MQYDEIDAIKSDVKYYGERAGNCMKVYKCSVDDAYHNQLETSSEQQ